MNSLGSFLLLLATILVTYSLVLGTIGAIKNDKRLIISSRESLRCFSWIMITALIVLCVLFVTNNYSNLYVWQHSSNDMQPMYLISAVWGGMDGSMLLWASIMSLFTLLAVNMSKQGPSERLKSWLIPCLSYPNLFFVLVVTFLTNPFREIPASIIHTNGQGLNPLLQNPSMMIHPPMLYLGFTGFIVPFAYSLAALCSSDLSTTWIKITRRWTLISWTFLTAGIILGGNWAYIELGWGGFWAWDPVENASFFPWLTGTAFLHSVMVQEHRGMLKIWNIALASLTYLLTVFGTFLTRSGIVQSVHAFASTDVGWVFLVYIGISVFIVTSLVIFRFKLLKPESKMQSYLSREAIFLFNNLLLLSITFATIWGVLLPVISEATSGEKIVVGPPFFNKVNMPLFLLLLFFMGVGPLVGWRSNSVKSIMRSFWVPFIMGSIITLLGIWIDGVNILPAISFGLSFFVITALLLEWHRRAKARSLISGKSTAKESIKLLRSKPRIYASHIIHIGVAMIAIAITGAYAYKTERDLVIPIGGTETIKNYQLKVTGIREERNPAYGALIADIEVYNNNNKLLFVLHPEKRIYTQKQEITTEVDIKSTLKEDLYVALAGLEDVTTDGKTPYKNVILKVFINPLQIWVWFSSIIIILGSLILVFESNYLFLTTANFSKTTNSLPQEVK